MAKAYKERVFDPSQPLVAAKPFTAAGRRFEVGAAFDWRKMAVDQRRVRNMFEIRLVDHPAGEEVAVEETPAAKPKATRKTKASSSKTDSTDA